MLGAACSYADMGSSAKSISNTESRPCEATRFKGSESVLEGFSPAKRRPYCRFSCILFSSLSSCSSEIAESQANCFLLESGNGANLVACGFALGVPEVGGNAE